MPRSRSLALGLCAAGALVLAGAGCRQDGSYRIGWSFYEDASPGALPQSAATGCGQHGVDAIFVTAADTTGDSDQAVALCTPGTLLRDVAAGTWSFTIQAVDAESTLIQSAADPSLLNGTVTGVAVSDGAVADVGVLSLKPLPECSDGVDNDRDGKVDLDDPGCAGNPDGTHE